MPDARPEATTEEVARWVADVQTMTADQLSDFDRRTCRAYQHHSLIDLIRAIAVRREQLERASWFRIKPTYRKPAGGFLAIGPLYRGEIVRVGAAIRFEWGDGAWIETVPIEHVEVDPEPRKQRNRWK
jgi:hypothetical protein